MFWYSGGPADGAHRHRAALVVHSGSGATCATTRTTTLERNTTDCPGNDQYFPDHDVNGVAIDRTYANGGHACVQVAYLPRTTSASCVFRFRVPSGHATARIVFGYWTTEDGVPAGQRDLPGVYRPRVAMAAGRVRVGTVEGFLRRERGCHAGVRVAVTVQPFPGGLPAPLPLGRVAADRIPWVR